MKIKTVFILLSLLLVISPSLQSQTVTNTALNSPTMLAPAQAQAITNREGQVIPPEDVAYFRKLGYTDEQIANAQVAPKQQQQATLSPTPPDLKNAIVYMDSFLGMTNTMLPADVISMKPASLKFRINGQDYDYSGNYTVMLNTPRQHKNPYFGFGSPETAKLVILEDFGGEMWPLQNATIWEKKVNYIDVVALDKEWIYSGTYTIQN